MKFSDDYGDLKIGDMIFIKGKCGKSWVKYKCRVKKFSEPNQELIFPTPHYTYRWKKIDHDL